MARKEGKPAEKKGKERQLVAESQRQREEKKKTTNPGGKGRNLMIK